MLDVRAGDVFTPARNCTGGKAVCVCVCEIVEMLHMSSVSREERRVCEAVSNTDKHQLGVREHHCHWQQQQGNPVTPAASTSLPLFFPLSLPLSFPLPLFISHKHTHKAPLSALLGHHIFVLCFSGQKHLF